MKLPSFIASKSLTNEGTVIILAAPWAFKIIFFDPKTMAAPNSVYAKLLNTLLNASDLPSTSSI